MTKKENELLCGVSCSASWTDQMERRDTELKKGPLILLSGRRGQPGAVGGEGLALHRDRCLDGFCRWFSASSRWALWQIFSLALLAQSGLR